MLVGPGGRERTEDEYASLFESAGFRLVGRNADGRRRYVVFEGEPV